MKKSVSPGLIALSLLILMASYGCKPEASNGSGDEPAQDSVPVRGDWARIYHYSDPDGFHPFNTSTGIANNIKENIYMNLIDRHPVTLELMPVLTVGMPEVSADEMHYTFQMRPEATWDNGDPITGDDFAFSLKCVKNPLAKGRSAASVYGFMTDVQVDPQDRRKFTVSLDRPHFAATAMIGDMWVISKNFYDSLDVMSAYSVGDFSTKVEELMKDPALIAFTERFNSDRFNFDPAGAYGSGPYKVESWTRGDNVTLVRKQDWWGDKLGDHGLYYPAGLDKLIFKVIVDKSTLTSAVKNDELDVVRDMNPEDFQAAANDTAGYLYKNYHCYQPPTYNYNYIALNCRPTGRRTPFFADLRLRKAVAHLTDLKGILENIYLGNGIFQVGPISPLKKDEYDPSLKGFEFDPAKATALLDEAGWVDGDGDGVREKVIAGKKVKLEPEIMVSNASEIGQRAARMIADQAQKVGMRIQLNVAAFSMLNTRLKAHEFDMLLSGFGGNPGPTVLDQIWSTKEWASGGANYFGFGDASTDSILAEIDLATDPTKRTALYHAFQKKWIEQLPLVNLIAPTGRLWIHKRFRNAQPTSIVPGYKPLGFWVPKEKQKFTGVK